MSEEERTQYMGRWGGHCKDLVVALGYMESHI